MNKSKSVSIGIRLLAILIIIAIAWSLRSRAVNLLSVDYDDDDYLRAAQQFTQLIRAKDWAGFSGNKLPHGTPPTYQRSYSGLDYSTPLKRR